MIRRSFMEILNSVRKWRSISNGAADSEGLSHTSILIDVLAQILLEPLQQELQELRCRIQAFLYPGDTFLQCRRPFPLI
jgi:hypothetical protein